MSYGTLVHTRVPRLIHMCALTHSYESRHTYEWVTAHIWMSQGTHMNESRHTYEWVRAHIWMSHGTHMNESGHLRQSYDAGVDVHGDSTGRRRPIGCLESQVIFRKRATNYRALLRKMTYKDKASYGSSPPCIAFRDSRYKGVMSRVWMRHVMSYDVGVETQCGVAVKQLDI